MYNVCRVMKEEFRPASALRLSDYIHAFDASSDNIYHIPGTYVLRGISRIHTNEYLLQFSNLTVFQHA
ncbi:hypothetical protein TWF102_009791 [Orbilia oligospora]|uniref:Uncharacterized protein n=1 Tax=Orbilia oligospora TaxID=2813651 RepID=A0A7C8J9S2_ORBOL|nr:hypothetical protein TWF102_009791 [Orbilia oligospora]